MEGLSCSNEYTTDFEILVLEKINNIKIQRSKVKFLRFINKSMQDNYFDINNIDKLFLLPTHKFKEVNEVIKKCRDNHTNIVACESIREYIPQKLLEGDRIRFEGQNHEYERVDSKLGHYCTSLYVLFYEEDISNVDDIITDEPSDFFLEHGLKICELLPLKNQYIALGEIEDIENTLIYLDQRSPSNEMIASHVSMYKRNKKCGLTYEGIAKRFRILSTEKISPARLKRKNKRR